MRVLFLLCLALAVSAPAAARDWLRAETPRFVIYSDGYPMELERWARKVENFDALLKAQFGGNDHAPGSKLTIYLLKDEKAVARLARRKNLTGFYSASSKGSFAVASRRPGYYKNRLSGQMTLFHEYAHHFMYRHFTSAYPVWYREGFAEYVSTATFGADWRSSFGLPAVPRLKYLRKEPLPIETILTASVEDFKPNKRARFYAWSWKLVHMLHSRADRRPQLQRYLMLFAAGIRPRQAAARAFGDLDRLESELRAYSPPDKATSRSSAPRRQQAKIPVVALDEVESELVDLQLARKVHDGPNRTLEAIRTLASNHPGNPEIQLELGFAEQAASIDTGDQDFVLARSAAQRAITLAPRNARAMALWADLETRRLKRDPAARRTDWAAVRRKLMIAIRLDRADPLALMTYYRTFVNEPRRPSTFAHNAMQRAFDIQPESVEIRLSHVYSLSIQGRFSEARKLARILASDPHAANLGRKALASITRIETAARQDAAKQTSAAPKH